MKKPNLTIAAIAAAISALSETGAQKSMRRNFRGGGYCGVKRKMHKVNQRRQGSNKVLH